VRYLLSAHSLCLQAVAHRTICALQQQQALEALAGVPAHIALAADQATPAAGAASLVGAGTDVGASASVAKGTAAFKPPPSAQAEMDEVFDDPFADPFVGGAGFSTSVGIGGEFVATRGRAASAAN
jgi:hypothetical protein